MSSLLVQTRARWAQRPTPMDRETRNTMTMVWPPWLEQGDLLFKLVGGWPQLYEGGRVVWARVLVANEVLWKPGQTAAVAVVLWSEDPLVDRNPGALSPALEAARVLGAGKAVPYAPAERARKLLRNDRGRGWKVPLPTELTNGVVTWVSTPIIDPRMLPGHHLADGLLPWLVWPEATDLSMPLPARWWSEELLRRWTPAS